MNNFVKMDVAIELLADKISKTTKQFNNTNNPIYQDELNNLMNQREKVYNGDIDSINNIINEYGEKFKF